MQRYELLRAWALQLTLRNNQEANDLLHDAFIHFTLQQSVIENVENLDAYLYTMIRNLRLSQVRRLARTPQGHLSMLEFDSAESGCRSVDPRAQVRTQDELRTICQYACIRKDSSKVGSVLILRFFYGYYPEEIAKIIRGPRAAVDNFVKTARREARLFQDNPTALSFFRKSGTSDRSSISFGRLSDDILAEMREEILRARVGECLTGIEILKLYEKDISNPIDVSSLAHLVSCPPCLDTANNVLGLPLLATRLTKDNTRQKPRKGDGDGDSSGGAAHSAFIDKGRKGLTEVIEHRPKELQISVNGFILGTQTINSHLSELTLNVNLDEKIAFVEIFSESNVRLFFLNLQTPPEGLVEQLSSVELSERRTLTVALSFSGPWPSLQAIYYDPTLETSTEAIPVEEVARSVQATELNENPASATPIFSRFSHLLRLSVWKLFVNPAAFTATATLLVLITALLWYWTRPTPSPSPSELLVLASSKERAWRTDSASVSHDTQQLEERKLVESTGAKTLIGVRRIEVWQSGARGLTARRLYDERSQLISGEWRRTDGVQTIYHHGISPRMQLTYEKSPQRQMTFADAWQSSLSIEDFSVLVRTGQVSQFQQLNDSYVISYVFQFGSLLEATVTLNRVDLRPTQETLLIREGGETREFHFVQASREYKSVVDIVPEIFEPDVELLSGATLEQPLDSKAEKKLRSSITSPNSAMIATPELEVEVLRILNQANADMGEDVTVNRTKQGKLRIEGVLDNSQRKSQILEALSPLLSNPAITVSLTTVGDAFSSVGTRKPNSAIVNGPVELPARIAVDSELRRYFSLQGLKSEELENHINQYATQAINRSLRIMQHAWAMKRLVNRFSLDDLQALDPQARGRWLSLVWRHSNALARENETLKQSLVEVFGVHNERDTDKLQRIKSELDLIATVNDLFNSCSVVDRILRQGFSISPDSSWKTSDTQPLWRGLNRIDNLSRSLSEQKPE